MNKRSKKTTTIARTTNRLNRLISTWMMQHLQAFIYSLGQICRYPISSFLTAAVIGIALALPTGFYLILENAKLVSAGWDNSVQITVFLKTDINDETAITLAQRLSERDKIKDVKFITRDLALEEYRLSSGYAEAIDALNENPLPSLLLIQPEFSQLGETHDDQLIKQLNEIPEIDNAQYDQQWVKRLHSIIFIVQRTVLILAAFLALAVLLIIGNTIRMAIYNRRSEIEVIKLFGATDAFIHRPFLYSGLWFGLSGGFIAWLLISLSLMLLNKPVNDLAHLYSSTYQLIGLNSKNILILLGTGVILGLVGSWISVQRHLKAIEPP